MSWLYWPVWPIWKACTERLTICTHRLLPAVQCDDVLNVAGLTSRFSMVFQTYVSSKGVYENRFLVTTSLRNSFYSRCIRKFFKDFIERTYNLDLNQAFTVRRERVDERKGFEFVIKSCDLRNERHPSVFIWELIQETHHATDKGNVEERKARSRGGATMSNRGARAGC